ncbi:MAG: DNRLRE domain-containing protein [Ginsengibacter sp.]
MANTTQNKQPMVDVKVHRRILHFLNAARRPEGLQQRPLREIPLNVGTLMDGVHEDESVKESKRISLLDLIGLSEKLEINMIQMKQPMIEAKVDREIDERVMPGPPKAAKLTTFIALGCVMLGSLIGCTKSKVTMTSVSMTSVTDATLYENSTGALSNGAGQGMFAGTKGAGNAVRGLVAFDVAGKVPAGMTLTAVKLRLNLSAASLSSAQTIGLYHVMTDWGEGSTVASGGGGGGGPASIGGATWLHTFFPDKFWSHPGGDFEATLSASIEVGDIGAYEWGSTGQMVADVQMWLDNPSSNHGWLLMGDDSATTVKRFDTRENVIEANRPSLTLTYK